ncbi:MAG: hypothetical protein AAF502_15965 [Bacteroidota bacterium]
MADQPTIDIQELTNPFPGLRSFEPGESHLFFGREKQIDELLRKLRANRFLAIVGNSGSGKSSLVKTGLLPRLDSGFAALAGSNWKTAIFRPGTDPLGNMAWSLAQKGVFHDRERMEPNYPLSIEQTLRSGSLGLVKALGQSEIGRGTNLLLVVDQFEELFKFSKIEQQSNEDRNDSFTFVNLLLNASKQKNVPIYIVLTMRSDFLGESTEFRGLPEAINDGQFLIPRMKRHEVRRAITGPLEYMDVKISARLVNRLLNDMGNTTDQLPILQHAMMRMWDKWAELGDASIVIDIEHYEAIGTMSKALSNHAQEAYDELQTPEARRICKKLFQALTDKGEDARGTRRPVKLHQLSLLCEAPRSEIIEVIEVFHRPGRSFLTGPPIEEMDGSSIISISHESLMRVWETLIQWIEEEAGYATIYQRLSEASILESQQAASLWGPPELQLGLNWHEEAKPNAHWAQRYDDNYDNAIDFLFRSKEAYERDKAIEEEERQLKLARARRIARVSFLLGFIFLILGVVSVISLQSAQKQKRKAEVSEKEANKAKDEAEDSAFQGFISQLEAEKAKIDAENEAENARAAEATALDEKANADRQAEIARLKEAEANIAKEKAIEERLRADEKTQEAIEERLRADEKTQEAVAERQRADNLKLKSTAQAVAVKSLQIEDIVTKALVSKEAYELHKLTSEEFWDKYDPYIHEALYEATKQLKPEGFNRVDWPPGVGHNGPVRGILMTSGQGKKITIGSDGKIMRWPAGKSSGSAIPERINQAQTLATYSKAALSPNNRWLIAGGEGKAIEVYDLNSPGRPSNEYTGAHNGKKLNAVAALRNNKGFVSSGNDKTIQKWHFQGNEPLGVFELKNHIRAMALSPDGRFLVTGNDAGVLEVWDLSKDDFEPLPSKVNVGVEVTALKFSPSGNDLAIGRADGFLSMIRNIKGRLGSIGSTTLLDFEDHSAKITDIDFNKAGTMLVTGSLDRTARVWIVDKFVSTDAPGYDPQYQPIVMRDHQGWVFSVAYLSATNQVIAGCSNGDIKIWDVETDQMADEICASEQIKVNLSLEDYDKYIGVDDEIRNAFNTCPDYLPADFYNN